MMIVLIFTKIKSNGDIKIKKIFEKKKKKHEFKGGENSRNKKRKYYFLNQ